VLVDTNLLVLLIVGDVNPQRIPQFKRTQKYTVVEYELLRQVLSAASKLYAIPQVFAEVNTLIDLKGPERLLARALLKERIEICHEELIGSRAAAQDPVYEYLGLNDAAISVAAKDRGFAVLTDDLPLYAALLVQGVAAVNFTHVIDLLWTQSSESF
jgi:hypothetical protein